MNDQFPPKQLSLNNVPPKQVILTMRIIWFALLMGPVAFMAALAFLFSQGNLPQAGLDPMMLQMFVIINAAMLVIVVPTVFFIRGAFFRRKQVNGVLPVAVYATGNIIFWAGCEGVSFFGLVIALLHRSFWPTILIVVMAMAAQAATMPRMRFIKMPDETFKIE